MIVATGLRNVDDLRITEDCCLLASSIDARLLFDVLCMWWISCVPNDAGFVWSTCSQMLTEITLAFLVGAWTLKYAWWWALDNRGSASNIETATGLGTIGKVRSLMPPHTSENYLQKEMGFVVARRHAIKLRYISIFFWSVASNRLRYFWSIISGHIKYGYHFSHNRNIR